MTVTKAKCFREALNDWFFFLLALPVVTAFIITEQFGMVDANQKCYALVNILKAKQTENAMDWAVRNHLISSKTSKYYEDIF